MEGLKPFIEDPLPVLSDGGTTTCTPQVLLVLLLCSVLPLSGAEIVFATAPELPAALLHRAYGTKISVRTSGRCASGGIGYEVVEGDLPRGLTLSAGGHLSGTPSRPGVYAFAVRATNGCAWASQPMSLTVTASATLQITPSPVVIRWKKNSPQPAAIVTVSSNRPNLAYTLNVSGSCVEATAERGRTVETGRVFEDTLILRPKEVNFSAAEPAGQPCAIIEIHAWQAEPVRVPVSVLPD